MEQAIGDLFIINHLCFVAFCSTKLFSVVEEEYKLILKDTSDVAVYASAAEFGTTISW